MVCTLMTDRKCLVSIGYNSYLVNGVMYFSILICLMLDLVTLCFGRRFSYISRHSMANLHQWSYFDTNARFLQNPLIIRSMLQVECVFFCFMLLDDSLSSAGMSPTM